MKAYICNKTVYVSDEMIISNFNINSKRKIKGTKIGTYNGICLQLGERTYYLYNEFPIKIFKYCQLDKYLKENNDFYVTFENFNDKLFRCKIWKDNNIKYKIDYPTIPTLSIETMSYRYSNVATVKIVDGNMFEFKKPSYEKISSVAYMWTAEENKISQINQNLDNLTLVLTITTFHTYTYHGFFKPALEEVLSQLPSSLDYDTKYYVTTDSYCDIQQETTCGNYHIGITTVYV
jgi:hypothetical protein